ncbi:MAG TPA: 3-hydroxyacyl-CoA dehydrogenase/enoyl-CoA hydratase family protein, partial [Verrucomicrobiae bacterium]|nr:3-hydroxyacyl-CoA dehydrogenase/enoyl-CoA hydratase family protein [Verrucomicrobiae bacterium]
MIRKVAVLGAGTMGAQIAGHAANAGLSVLLMDVSAEQVRTGLQALEKSSPAALFVPDKIRQIEKASFDQDLARIAEADWIVEAIVEDARIKQSLLERVDRARKPGTLITTNTSGLSVTALAEGRSEDFRKHWFGTHFFNPPRYMRLLEIIPTASTDPQRLAAFEHFAEAILGKGVVHAKDTPNFIANRIGLFAALKAIQLMEQGGFTIEEVDRLTGPLIGRAKTATFRTIDLVGLDIFANVASNIYDNAPNDEQREIFRIPAFMRSMLDRKMLGAKTSGGFYKKEGSQILTLDLATMEYRPQRKSGFPALEMLAEIEPLAGRLKALLKSDDRAARFASELLRSISIYAAARIPEISDNPEAVDRAMRWGFAWDIGPFEFEKLLRGETVAPVSFLEKHAVIQENAGASLRDLGDGVLCLEFHSKMNTIGNDIISLLFASLDEVNKNFDGLVIGNEGRNFSAGANLMLLMMEAVEGNWDEIDYMVRTFQRATQAIRYNPKPVVTAPFALALGGGCELAMAGARAQALAETYIGLVELGAGLIPAGGGTTEMLRRAEKDGAAGVREVFQNIGRGKVSTSAEDARRLLYLRSEDGVTMNADRLIPDAKAIVMQLSATGYRPPVAEELRVFGAPLAAEMKLGIHLMRQAGYITDYEAHIARKLAHVICGGDATRQGTAPEQYFLDLEREAFKSLCGEQKTR